MERETEKTEVGIETKKPSVPCFLWSFFFLILKIKSYSYLQLKKKKQPQSNPTTQQPALNLLI